MGTFSFAGRWGPEALIDRFGNAQASASVKVYDSDGVTLSTLYTDRTKGTTSSNPFAPDARANATFFANPGPHVLKITVGSSVTTLNVDVPIDPDEASTDTEATAAIAAHAALATGVHGVGGSTVESASGAQAKADAAQAAAIAASAIDATTKANAAAAASQPLDSDLTAIAALSTTTYGRAFLALADAAAGRTALGLGTAATAASTAFDAAGAAAAAQAASQPVDSDLTAIAALSTTSFGRSFLDRADAAAGRTLLGLGTAATTDSASYGRVWTANTAYATNDIVLNPNGRTVTRIAAGTSRATYDATEEAAWTGPRIRVGDLPMDPTQGGLVKFQAYDNSPTGLVIWLSKVNGDVTDLNMDGSIFVKHAKGYTSTAGYADTLQVYTLAGSAGTILGNNSYQGLDTSQPYAPPLDGSAVPTGFVRFELGPTWPFSEIARFNNGLDFIVGFRDAATFTCSQSGTTVTSTGGTFTASHVGKWFCWGSAASGKAAYADRITAFIDAAHVTVERSRTIASQNGFVQSASFAVGRDGTMQASNGLHLKAVPLQTGTMFETQNSSGTSLFVVGLAQMTWADASPDGAAEVNLRSTVITNKVLVLKGFSASQSGSLLELQRSTGTVVLKVSPTQLVWGSSTPDGASDWFIKAQGTADKGVVVQAFSSSSTANLIETQFSDGTPSFAVGKFGGLQLGDGGGGLSGNKIWSSAGVPASGIGANNDWNISANGHLYFKAAGAWSQVI